LHTSKGTRTPLLVNDLLVFDLKSYVIKVMRNNQFLKDEKGNNDFSFSLEDFLDRKNKDLVMSIALLLSLASGHRGVRPTNLGEDIKGFFIVD
jgi:hypothetical protein